jgi:hypothetical protein
MNKMSAAKSCARTFPFMEKQQERKAVEWGDYLFASFFILHIPIALVIPPQFLFPSDYFPAFVKNLLLENIEKTRDPILSTYLLPERPAWILAIFAMEVFLQVPFFFYAAFCLLTGRRFVKSGIAYCVHVLTTNALIVAHIITQPATTEEIAGWLFTYAPFWMIPLLFMIELLQ